MKTSKAADELVSATLPVHVSGGNSLGCQDTNGGVAGLLHVQNGDITRLSATRVSINLVEGSYADFFKNAEVFFVTEKYPKDHFSVVSHSSDSSFPNRRLLSKDPVQSQAGSHGWFTNALSRIWNTVQTVASVAAVAVNTVV
jgi:hypothetical protein